MVENTAEVLTYAVAVAISPVPNGPMLLVGWVVAAGVVSAIAYLLADAGDAATDSTTADTISWGQIVFGALCLLVAARQWSSRPAPGVDTEMPRWTAGIDSFSPVKTFSPAVFPAGVSPRTSCSPPASEPHWPSSDRQRRRPSCRGSCTSVLASITIAGPVVDYLLGGDKPKDLLDEMKARLALHNAAVMTTLFLFFGVKLLADGLPALGS